MATAMNYNEMSDSAKKKEDWMNTKWRPMMGWTYMLTCITDFVIFPILWSLIQALGQGQVNVQWQPITLQGAGLFHIAMGAILGIAVYGRTKEKLEHVAGPAANNSGSTYTPPPAPPRYYNETNYASQTNYRTQHESPAVFTSRSGKTGPMEPEYPII
jgi:hypothetical protein